MTLSLEKTYDSAQTFNVPTPLMRAHMDILGFQVYIYTNIVLLIQGFCV